MELHRQALTTVVLLGMSSGTAWAGINEWTSVGPEGGSVQSLAVDPQNPSTVYASTLFHLYRSTDGAVSWAKTGFTGYAGNLVIDPLNSGTLYASTLGRVSKSSDGGATWSDASSGLSGGSILRLIIDPQNSSTLYALTSFAISGQPLPIPGMFPPTVYKTTDGGVTWYPSSSGLTPGNYALTLAIDPRNPSTLYAGTASAPFPRNTASGLFRSTDGGASWNPAGVGIPDCCVTSLAIDPQDSTILYAAWMGTGGVGGIVRSTDGGTTWTDQGSDLQMAPASLVVDPQNQGTLYATTFTGLVKSTNGGTNWSPANLAGRVQTFALDPQNPATIYAASAPDSRFAGGLFKTTDGGNSWNGANSGIRAIPVRNLAIDPQHSGTLYAANGGTIFKTADGGANWIAGDIDAFKVAIDPQDPDTVFAMVYGIFQPAKSTDGGATWTRLNLPLAVDDNVTDLAIDPQDFGVVYAGTAGEGVFKSADGGESWSLANSGLPQDSVIVLAIARGEATAVYASTADCNDSGCVGDGIFKSTDGGSSWTAANSGLPGGYVSLIAIDPQNPAALYIGLVTKRTELFKSADAGASWEQLSSALPDAAHVVSLAIDPRDSGTVYVGTDTGVLRSTDGGDTWSAVNSGLPGINVSSLAIDPQCPNRVYAATDAGLFAITLL